MLVTNTHELLLEPLLFDATAPYAPHEDVRFLAELKNEVPLPAGLPNGPGQALCAAVGASFRSSLVSNARVSSYGFCVPAVLKSFPDLDKTELKNYGGQFFTELLDLYFSIFGRWNTLNEYFLDQVLVPGMVRSALSVQFREKRPGGEARPLLLDLGDSGGIVALSVSGEVASFLTNDWTLADEFWRIAWLTFRELVILEAAPVSDDARKSLQKDWAPVAAQRMRFASKELPLLKRLHAARLKAEEHFCKSPTNTFQLLDQLYPDKKTSCGQKLERLLLMLQGSLSLIPWARDGGGTPLPVITIPVIGADYRCAWTIIPTNPKTRPKQWGKCQQFARTLFADAVKPYEQLASELQRHGQDQKLDDTWKAEFNEWKTDPQKAHLISQVVSDLVSFGSKFFWLVKAAKHLTGIRHEGRGTSYCLLYGPAELLKYAQRVISNERSPGRIRSTAAQDEEDQADYFRLRCEGHYALFQQEGVAGFIDQVHGPLVIDKVVVCRSPTDDELGEMRADNILDDRHRAVRWLTWQFRDAPNKVAALIAGSDGVLRLFLKGKLLLAWRRQSDPDTNHWELGVEYDRAAGSPAARLRERLQEALGADAPLAGVQDLVTTICEISDTPGEGAVFVIGGKASDLPVLCDMVPDEFKMEWALVRQLSGLEQRMLHSLAVMDGAVHIATADVNGKAEAWVCARRYIAAVAEIRANAEAERLAQRALTGEIIVTECFEPWIKHLRICGAKGAAETKALERLLKWRSEIGTKGTRHRSVFQLCLWLLHHTHGDNLPLVCSVSADGPVHLYQVRKCPCGNQTYIWTEKVNS
jgi:hypothetical protein